MARDAQGQHAKGLISGSADGHGRNDHSRLVAEAARALAADGHAVVLLHHPGSSAEAARALREAIATGIAGAGAGRMANSITILRDSKGAPHFSAPYSPDGRALRCSFASRAEHSLIGVARCRIGVDLDLMPFAGGIPDRLLRPDERQRLAGLAAAEAQAAFLTLWTAKEAFAKALGLGLALPPEAIRVGPAEVYAVVPEGLRGSDQEPTISAPLLTWQHNRALSGGNNDDNAMGCSALFLAAVLLPGDTG